MSKQIYLAGASWCGYTTKMEQGIKDSTKKIPV